MITADLIVFSILLSPQTNDFFHQFFPNSPRSPVSGLLSPKMFHFGDLLTSLLFITKGFHRIGHGGFYCLKANGNKSYHSQKDQWKYKYNYI